ncbi:hypothetical protein [Halobacillus sp. Marseille-Q1614]|uniref:hypothetical protein n=1 Tax=Halobacillus sp. Marseille-Q1614 TaxID=2709134 RepID=UPI001570ED17|nr:hypothetical protein [Halobacillus sp. Marseille-Q1614]
MRKITPASLLFMCFAFLVAGCSSSQPAESADREAETNIKKVLEHQFTGPDQELLKHLKDPGIATVIGIDGETKPPKKSTPLDQYLQDTYGEYFTENMYEKFVLLHAMSYYFEVEDSSYTINLVEADIREDVDTEDAYFFTARVLFENENDAYTAEVTGKANVNEDKKIERMLYFDDDRLIEKINAERSK